jgi:hypothetical protein
MIVIVFMSPLRHPNTPRRTNSFLQTTQSPALERSLSRYTCNVQGNVPTLPQNYLQITQSPLHTGSAPLRLIA